MSRNKIINNPTRVSDLSYDELYEDISRDWEQRAQRLRARRLRKLKLEQI